MKRVWKCRIWLDKIKERLGSKERVRYIWIVECMVFGSLNEWNEDQDQNIATEYEGQFLYTKGTMNVVLDQDMTEHFSCCA